MGEIKAQKGHKRQTPSEPDLQPEAHRGPWLLEKLDARAAVSMCMLKGKEKVATTLASLLDAED